MKKPTKKQKDFAKEYVLGEEPGNGTKAAFSTYNVKSKVNAGNIARTNLNKPIIQKEIQEIMEAHNLTDDFLFQRVKEGLDANIVSEYKGEVVETSVPDRNLRHKYTQDLLKVKGLYAPERKENLNLTIATDLEAMPVEDFKKLVKELLDESTSSRNNQKVETRQGQE